MAKGKDHTPPEWPDQWRKMAVIGEGGTPSNGWVSPSGVFYHCGLMGHTELAFEMFRYVEELEGKEPKDGQVRDSLFGLGWARVAWFGHPCQWQVTAPASALPGECRLELTNKQVARIRQMIDAALKAGDPGSLFAAASLSKALENAVK